MSWLYITENGATIGVQENRVVVKQKENGERSIPIEALESIEIFGKSQMTVQMINECLRRKIPVSFHSPNGEYHGYLIAEGYQGVFRQKAQLHTCEDERFSLEIGKAIVKAKLHNQAVLLRRYERSKRVTVDSEWATIIKMEARVERCHEINEVIGCEGYGARQYFKGLGLLVEEDFTFTKRSRRPPKDEFNAMLSLGYTMLFHEIYAKIEKKGLNPYFGYIHQDKENHPTLVSDLMEEWRAVIVDAVVMSLVNGHEIRKEHFCKSEVEGVQGFLLNREGMKLFINKIEQKMRTKSRYLRYIDYPVAFRQALDLQINQLVKAINQNIPELYQPIRIR